MPRGRLILLDEFVLSIQSGVYMVLKSVIFFRIIILTKGTAYVTTYIVMSLHQYDSLECDAYMKIYQYMCIPM